MKSINSNLKKAKLLKIMDELYVCYSIISLEEEKAFFEVTGSKKPFVIKLIVKDKNFNTIIGPTIKDVNRVVFDLHPYKKISEIVNILHQSIDYFNREN